MTTAVGTRAAVPIVRKYLATRDAQMGGAGDCPRLAHQIGCEWVLASNQMLTSGAGPRE